MADNQEDKVRDRRISIPLLPYHERDCRAKFFLVLSTFNEAQLPGDRPTLLIPGHVPELKREGDIHVAANPDYPRLTVPDMPAAAFDSAMRSLHKANWRAMAVTPKVIVTDARTLAFLFRLLADPAERRHQPDVWLNLEAVGHVVFMKSPDPSADKTPRLRAAEDAVATSSLVHCPRARSFKRVVRYHMADVALYVEDDSQASVDTLTCVREEEDEERHPQLYHPYNPFAPFARSHLEGVKPLRRHRTAPDPTAETARVPGTHHVRVVEDKRAAGECDADMYFTGSYLAQNFVLPTTGDNGVIYGPPLATQVRYQEWEAENRPLLREFTTFLDRVGEIVCKETARNPGAKFVSHWRKRHVNFTIWYTASRGLDGSMIRFGECPRLVSKEVREMLETVIQTRVAEARASGRPRFVF